MRRLTINKINNDDLLESQSATEQQVAHGN